MALTAKTIENTKPQAKPQRLWDANGLYLEVAPTGGKWWRFKYRFGGKEKRLSLGTFPDVQIRGAHQTRDDARKLLNAGIDPSAQRQAERRRKAHAAANSCEWVAREWYERQTGIWTPGHAADVLRRLETNLFPEIGDKPIAEINAPALRAAVGVVEGPASKPNNACDFVKATGLKGKGGRPPKYSIADAQEQVRFLQRMHK